MPSQAPDPEINLLDCIPTLEPDLSAQPFLTESFWSIEFIGLLVILFLLLTAGLVYWQNTRKKVLLAPPSPEQIAYRELDMLKQAPEAEQSIPRISVQLSLILREYLTGETNDPALFETHQEFSQRMNALDKVPASKQLETRMLLEQLAENKYINSQERKPSACEKLCRRSLELIRSISQERLELQKKALIGQKKSPKKLQIKA